MSDFDSTPILLPWWRQSKKIIPVVVLALLLVPAVVLVGIRQLSPKASNAISIQVSPGAIDQSSSPQIGKPVYLSATAVDEIGRPITTGVSYAWGMSSNFPVSPTFKPSNNLAAFTPNSTGSGSLWVSAITSESSAIKYIDVCVGVPCPSYTNPTPVPTPGGCPIAPEFLSMEVSKGQEFRVNFMAGLPTDVSYDPNFIGRSTDCIVTDNNNIKYCKLITGGRVGSTTLTFSDFKGVCPTKVNVNVVDTNKFYPYDAVLTNDSATFPFKYSGNGKQFYVDVYAKPYLGYDNQLNFAAGTASPLINNKPTTWRNYTCYTAISWIVKSSLGEISQPRTNSFNCNYPTPIPASFSNLSASLPASGPAVFNFVYAGAPTTTFAVDISTKTDMSSDVYSTFVWGSSSPLVENNPTKWDKYSCGRTLYWIVKTPSGDKSAIVASTIKCPSSTPTPTPTPIPNYTPTIVTTNLPVATVGLAYSTSVYGTDHDLNDILSMGLKIPDGYGLYAGPCNVSVSPATISCTIFGTPIKSSPGIPVTVSLTDRKATVSANLALSINPSSTSTPAPTPTPTPISNTPPTIVTQILPAGFVGRVYSTSVTATDVNLSDNLKASVTGLPPLLSLTGCTQFVTSVHNLVCTISGTPNRFGTFPVRITVTDSANASTTKVINLPILKKYILF